MRFSIALTALALTVLLGACSTSAPIMNIPATTVTGPSGQVLSREQVRSAIVRAGTGLGWQIKDESPTLLVGTLYLRDHTAVIEIPYSSTSYSIKYRSSTNLKERDGNIHRNYNGWIQNLNRAIGVQLSTS